MSYILPVLVVVLGLGVSTAVEIAAELSGDTLNDTNVGVTAYETATIAGGIVDMRPEASLRSAATEGQTGATGQVSLGY